MKKISILFSILFLLLSTNLLAAKRELPVQLTAAQESEATIHYNQMRDLVAQSLELRERASDLYDQFKIHIDAKQSFSKVTLEKMRIYQSLLLKTRSALFTIYYNNKRYIIDYSASEYERAGSEGAYKKALIALAAKTINDDNYVLAVVPFLNVSRMRDVLNKQISEIGVPEYSLYDSEKLFTNYKDYKAKRNGFYILHKFYSYWVAHGLKNSNQMRNLYEATINSTTLKYWKIIYPHDYPFKLSKKFNIGVDIADSIWEGTIFGISKAFGFTIGSIQWKDGKLTNNVKLANQMKETLQPLDVLLERTRNRVSGKFIPGFWVHGAVWLGTEEQLKELGIWDAPEIQKLQKQIREGQSIIEALRYGVVLNTVEHFLNVDDLVIARPLDYQEPAVIKDRILATARLYGKKYDFGFNGESENTVYCTEVVASALNKTDIPMTSIAGTWYHSPDGVAQLLEDPLFFDINLLYVDGKEITKDKIDALAEIRKSNRQ